MKFKHNQILKTKGLDMQCREVDTYVKFIKYVDHKKPLFDCVVELESGMLMYDNSESYLEENKNEF